METKRTMICKVSDKITKKKMSYLDKISARITRVVSFYIESIEKNYEDLITDQKKISKSKLDKFKPDVNLSSGYVQQCRDKAIWMYNSYITHSIKWKKSFESLYMKYKDFYSKNRSRVKDVLKKKSEAVELHKKEKSLLRSFFEFRSKVKRAYAKGKPKVPLKSKKYVAKKIPIAMDERTCSFVKLEDKDLTKYWLSLSTLKKHHKVYVPLSLSDYHISKIEGQKISSIQLIKKKDRYYVHLSYSIDVDINTNPTSIKAVDLGINKAAVTVLLPINSKLTRDNIKIYKIKHLKERLHRLDFLIKEYQRKKLYKKLSQIKNKRFEIKLRFDHLLSKQIARDSKDEDVRLLVGNLSGIRNRARRGNYKGRNFRRKINRWSFKRLVEFITYKCNAYKIPVQTVTEAYTSKRCHKCRSLDTKRPTQGLFICNFDKTEYNADINGSINIGLDYYINNIDPDYMFGLRGAKNTS